MVREKLRRLHVSPGFPAQAPRQKGQRLSAGPGAPLLLSLETNIRGAEPRPGQLKVTKVIHKVYRPTEGCKVRTPRGAEEKLTSPARLNDPSHSSKSC